MNPERAVTVRFVDSATADTADAVIVIAETDPLAGGRISAKAADALGRFKTQQGTH